MMIILGLFLLLLMGMYLFAKLAELISTNRKISEINNQSVSAWEETFSNICHHYLYFNIFNQSEGLLLCP